MLKVSLAILVSVAATPGFALTYANVEAVTGGTFLNFMTLGETRNSITISGPVLGPSVPNLKTGSGTVNWSVNDTSDGTRFVNGMSVEDNNIRSGPTTASPPWVGSSFNPFKVTLSGLVPNQTYDLKTVAVGLRPDPVSDPTGTVLATAFPDFGIGTYDFSYGPSSGSQTTVGNVAAGSLIYEEISSATVISGSSYYYYKGSYANDIGNWTADGSGNLVIWMGQGNVNTFDNGARTMMDGLSVTLIPEPSTLALVGLGGLALVLRRRK